MRSTVIYSSIVAMLVVSTGCQSSMPRWDWWRSASTSSSSASSIAQSSAPALPSSVASSGVSAPTGQYPATAYPTTPATAYGAPNMASATQAGTPPAAETVGPQTSPYNPYAYGPPAGASGQVPTQPAYTAQAPPATTPAYAPPAQTGGAPSADSRYGSTIASGPTEYQSGSRYDSPTANYNTAPQGTAAVATTAPVAPQGGPTNQYGAPPMNPAATNPSGYTQAPAADYRAQAPVSTADARSQYNAPQAAAPPAPTTTAGTPYRPAGTGTYTPVGAGAVSSSPEATQPASYQQAAPAPAGQYQPSTANPMGSDSRYGGRY